MRASRLYFNLFSRGTKLFNRVKLELHPTAYSLSAWSMLINRVYLGYRRVSKPTNSCAKRLLRHVTIA